MAEPSLDRLIRFTPDAGGLDRDALLFAAGRSSARPARGWKALAALLAGTQALSLALLWPRPTAHPGGLTLPVARAPGPPEAIAPPTSRALVNPGPWSSRHGLRQSEPEDRPPDTFTLIESGPPLRAFPRPASLLN